MPFPVEDIISAPNSAEAEHYFDYAYPKEQLSEQVELEAFYSIAFVISFVLIFVRLYTSILGRRMRNEGLRWHSIFISIFNVFQVILFANTATNSPWLGYLQNDYILKHSTAFEQITFTAFLASVIFLGPIYLLTHIFPRLRKTFFFRWFVWLLIYLGLTGASVFLVWSDNKSSESDNYLPLYLINYYHFFLCQIAGIVCIMLLLCLPLCYLCTCSYALLNLKNPDRSMTKKKFKNSKDLLMITAYIWTCSLFNAPKNIIILLNFYIKHMSPQVVKSEQFQTLVDENPQDSMEKIFKLVDFMKQVVLYGPIAELLFPISEFVAASVFLQMYRESLLNIFSCGFFYHDDRDGSIWRLLRKRYRIMRSLNPMVLKIENA